jgi:SpoVK/Ycf46/Vps4 family AAA+-type ATPase
LWLPFLDMSSTPREITSLRLTAEDIVRVGQHARVVARVDDTEVTPAVIRQATRRLGGHQNTRPANDSAATMDDLILPDDTRSEVLRLLAWARSRDEVLAQGPLQGKGGKGTGICALFSGSPGTGKTLAAHIIADSLGMDLISVELSSVVDKYIGETEKNLEKVFTEAESLNAILFFDEADSLFGSRSEVKDAKDRYANQEVAYLLQRMEQFDGITVLATNLRGNLDPAFSRRLHFIIHFPDPDPATRAGLWNAHLGHLAGMDDADPVLVDQLAATVELSGGDIRNVVLSAAYSAVAESSSVGMRHIVDAVVREYAKLGRRVPATPMFARRPA